MTLRKVDLTKWPYHGVYATVARQLSDKGQPMTKQNVRQHVLRGNQEMINLVNAEIDRRKEWIEEGRRAS